MKKMKKSKKLRIWSRVCGFAGLVLLFGVTALSIGCFGVATIPVAIPYVLLGVAIASGVGCIYGSLKLDDMASKQLYKETHKDKISLIEALTPIEEKTNTIAKTSQQYTEITNTQSKSNDEDLSL